MSSVDLRFTFVLFVVGAIVFVFGSVLVSQLRAADWTGATISGQSSSPGRRLSLQRDPGRRT
jgi:hypothetical protein